MLLKLEWFEVREMEKRKVLVDGVDTLEKIENSETKDNEVVKAVKEMKKAEVIVLGNEEQREENRIIIKRE